MNVELYTDVNATLPEPVVLPPFLDHSDLTSHQVLVVDDVADSGRTLKLVMGLLEGWGVEADTAMFLEKPQTAYRPTYSWRKVEGWIDFPWSYEGPVPGALAADSSVAAE